MSGGGLTVVIVPPATANGPIHVGHLSGPYLAADMVARAARARGERVLAIAGFDVHQNWVLTRAENDGIDAGKLAGQYRDEIVRAYHAARIRYDVFLDPQSEAYADGVRRLAADLVDAGVFPMRETTLYACADCRRTLHHSYVLGTCARCGSGAAGGGCEGCGGYTSADNLRDAHCGRCGGAPEPFTATVPVLPLEDHRETITRVWQTASLSGRGRRIVAHYLESGLPTVPLAYPTNWGLDGTGPLDGLKLEVYLEVGLSTVYGVATGARPGATGLARTAQALADVDAIWHFNGIDNGFYFSVFWPAVYTACGLRPGQLGGTVTNEFYTLDGAKFSTSRNHAIWANEFLAEQDVDVVRLFLAWDRPDRYASDFTMASYTEFESYVRPLLDGRPATLPLPDSLAAADVRRGLDALRPAGFDAALAIRSLLAGLAAGAPGTDALRTALTGR